MKYHTIRSTRYAEYNAEIGRFFGQLPPTQFRQALNLRNTITSLDGAQSGFWQDILSAGDAQPWLKTHCWLLDAYQYPAGPGNDSLEDKLYPAMFFTYLTFWLNESIQTPDTIFDSSYRQLANTLQAQTKHYFQQLFPLNHPFWQDYQTIYQAYHQTINWQQERYNGLTTTFDTADWQHYANRYAQIKLGVTAVIHRLDQSQDLASIWQMIDAANQALRIQEDIVTLRRDLLSGHLSYPIMRTIELAGLPVKRPFNPEQIMGAAILTGSIKKVCAEAASRLQTARDLAAKQNITPWLAYCDQLQHTTDNLQSLFSLKSGDSSNQKVAFLPYRDIMGQSLNMAASYLLADPAFNESIEINRGGLEGLNEAQGIIFPLSFITYLLLENGHDLPHHIDNIFVKMEALGYRYYENMAIAPDTDETAILLRLFKHSPNQAQHRRQLERPLKWLVDNIQPDGSIPAFWNIVDIDTLDRMVIWENYCLTAEINTLLGLIAYDWARFQPLIEQSANGVFGRYLNSDFGTVAYYDLRYTLWQTLALAHQLAQKTAIPELIKRIQTATPKLTDRLALEASREVTTPQQAAFLILACLDSNNESFLDPAWITFLHKTQRYDGSWDNEPIFITCDRDGLPGNWYSSRTMTTAFCYHALNHYHKRPNL